MRHPIVVELKTMLIGLKSMLRGVYAFAWFAFSAAFAWMIPQKAGWIAALYFVGFAGCLVYGFWCLYELGRKAVKNSKKGIVV